MRKQLSPYLKLKALPQTECLYSLAAYLGMHQETLNLVEKMPQVHLRYDYSHQYKFFCGLGSSKIVESQMRRLNFAPKHDPIHLRLCLATTEYSALDLIRN